VEVLVAWQCLIIDYIYYQIKISNIYIMQWLLGTTHVTVGTRVQFQDDGERGVREGVVKEIIYIVNRDIHNQSLNGYGGQSTSGSTSAICAENDTPIANEKHKIFPYQIIKLIKGGKRRTLKLTNKVRRNRSRFFRRK